MELLRMQGFRRQCPAAPKPTSPTPANSLDPWHWALPPITHYLRRMLIIHSQHTRSFITIPAPAAITISLFDCHTYRPTLARTHTHPHVHAQEFDEVMRKNTIWKNFHKCNSWKSSACIGTRSHGKIVVFPHTNKISISAACAQFPA